jgi:acyl carrier protein
MNKQEIIEKINNALAKEFEVDLSKMLDIDSLNLADMITLVESVSDVEIHNIVSIKTFEELYEFVEARRQIEKS